MHIVHISSELAPIAKAGGLADVVYGLSKELIRQGHTVQVILPKYDCIDYSLLKNLKVYLRDLWSYDGSYRYHNTIWSAEIDCIPVFLVEPHHPNYFFSRGMIYGCDDDNARFLYFSRTVMEFLFKSPLSPDVIHCHDWPTAIIPVLHDEMYLSLGFKTTRTLLTLHNLDYQGKCSPQNLTQIGLRGEDYLTPERMQDPENPYLINLLKGGISYAKVVTTVSPSYEEEIKNSSLIKTPSKLVGILNGIDEDFWNPEIDPFLAQTFSAHPPFSEVKWKQIEEGKEKNKKALRERLGLKQRKAPLVACITRLVPQKSPLLIAHAFRHLLQAGAQCIILGSVYSEEMKELFSFLSSEYTSNDEGIILLQYDEALSHLIYAGSDMLMIPSLFEPCGLTQMIALRYGSIPIVRETGGLKDTVFDIDNSSVPLKERNGFSFEKAEKEEFHKTLDRALLLWKEHPKKWEQLMKQGMQKDFSWKAAAQEYLLLYQA